MAQIRERIESESDALGKEIVEDVQASISTPVEHFGDIIIRSQPGEAPRLEYGHLWESERHEVLPNGEGFDIINDAAYAKRLEYGDGPLAPRPFHAPARERWEPQIRERIINAVVGNNG